MRRSPLRPVDRVVSAAADLRSARIKLADHLAEHHGQGWSSAADARLAADLFVGAVALACAGIVALATVSAPEPTVHLRRLAAIVSLRSAAELPSAPESVAAEVPPTSTATTTTAPAPTTIAPATPAPATTAPVDPNPSNPPVGARPPTARGGLPIGKGMWIWLEDRADGGDPVAIVARAKAYGLTHLYVRTGTLKGGFVGGPFLDRLLPVAHANNLRVYGWDFPYLDHPGDDVNRALAAIRYTTPDGHRIDGFSADIETAHEGTNNDLEFVTAYCTWLRQNVGDNYPLIATVPNPTDRRLKAGFPYAAIVPHFDAVAPMVYWMNRDPATDVAHAVSYLSQWGKPVFPIGQAYDGGPEGGPPGVPDRATIIRFLQYAQGAGASGVSFWSYQHASQEAWEAIRDAGEFRLDLGGVAAEGLNPGMVRAYQTVLAGFGYPTPTDGVWGPATIEALKAYQAAARLPVTGRIDAETRAFLLAPVAAPVAAY